MERFLGSRLLGWLACVGALVLLVIAMVTGTTAEAAGHAPRVTGATVRLSPVPGRPAAGYFTLTAGVAPVELTGVASPPARVALHGVSMAGGVMRMNALPSVRVAAGGVVRFAPGGAHLMLFAVPAYVHAGSTLPLTFAFADGSRIRVEAAVVAAGAEPMAGMKM